MRLDNPLLGPYITVMNDGVLRAPLIKLCKSICCLLANEIHWGVKLLDFVTDRSIS